MSLRRFALIGLGVLLILGVIGTASPTAMGIEGINPDPADQANDRSLAEELAAHQAAGDPTERMLTETLPIEEQGGEATSDTGGADWGVITPGISEAIVLLAAYSRYNEISPLEHELRANITEIVAGLPGIYLAQLVKRTDRPASTVRYHTRVLDREGELQRAAVWGNLRLFPADMDADAFAYYAAIRDPASARVLEAIEQHEPVTPGELSTLIDRAPSTVSHHLSRFEQEDLIDRHRDGESVQVTIAEDVRPYTNKQPAS